LAFLHGDTFSFRKISHNLLTSKKFYLSWSQAIRKNKGKVKKKKEKKNGKSLVDPYCSDLSLQPVLKNQALSFFGGWPVKHE
jgi:hypothetical protein